MAETTTYNRYSWLLAACVIVVVVLAGNWPLLSGRAAPQWAGSNYYGPLFSLVADHAKAGKLFLWNPWMNGGTPDFVDPQEGAISPVLLLYAVVIKDSLTGYIAYWMTAWIFGGFGMLLLCRHLKCPPWGGLIAALGFVTCGYYTGHAQHMSFLYAFSYIPWIVWRFDVAIVRRSYWVMVQAGVIWGLSALGGYPALTILDPVFLALWLIGRVWLTGDDLQAHSISEKRKLAIFAVAGLCLLGVIGGMIMSPSYIALVKFAKGYSFRTAALDRHRALAESVLPPLALGTFASPYLYLLNWPGQGIWPETDISMSNIYMGVLVVSLAAMALTMVKRGQRWRLWLLVVIGFFFACSVGIHSPVRGWLYDLVPPTRYFRHSSLFSAYGIFACCILAAMGAKDLDTVRMAQPRTDRWRFLAVAVCVAIVAGLMYAWILRVPHSASFDARNPTILFCGLWLSVIAVFLLWWKRALSDRIFVVVLVAIAIVDAGSTLHASRNTIYSAEYLHWWNLIKARHIQSLDLTATGFTRTLYPSAELGAYEDDVRNIVVKQAAFTGDTGLRNQFFPPYIFDPVLTRLVVGPQRIWFSDRPVWLAPNAGSFAAYIQASHSLGTPPLVLHTAAEMVNSSDLKLSAPHAEGDEWERSARPVTPATVDLIEYHPNSLSFRYAAERDGWLLVTDRWAPSWRAQVNGRSVEVPGANFLFRAVPVTRGENVVRFQYAPRGYKAMVLLSWSIIVLFVMAEIFRLAFLHRSSGD